MRLILDLLISIDLHVSFTIPCSLVSSIQHKVSYSRSQRSPAVVRTLITLGEEGQGTGHLTVPTRSNKRQILSLTEISDTENVARLWWTLLWSAGCTSIGNVLKHTETHSYILVQAWTPLAGHSWHKWWTVNTRGRLTLFPYGFRERIIQVHCGINYAIAGRDGVLLNTGGRLTPLPYGLRKRIIVVDYHQ